jgi:hypothetical protein
MVVNPPKCLVYRCAYVKKGVVKPPKPLSTGVPMSKWEVVNPPKLLSTGVQGTPVDKGFGGFATPFFFT